VTPKPVTTMLNQIMINLEAPIKINLALHVTGQEVGGYHSLQSLVTFAQAGDGLSAKASAEDDVILEGEYGHLLSAGEENLIVKARNLLRMMIGKAAFPVCLTLTKNLPPASGLGGGSADAAATLLTLKTLWQEEIDKKRLYDLARQLGADVPMCLSALQKAQALLATGIGDELTQLPNFPPLDMVIVNPNKKLATPAVFAALTQKNNPPFELNPHSLDTVDKVIETLKLMRNDLTPPANALMPEIGQILRGLEKGGASLARMSGSGASCFGIYKSQAQAQEAAAAFQAHYPDYFIKPVHTVGEEIK